MQTRGKYHQIYVKISMKKILLKIKNPLNFLQWYRHSIYRYLFLLFIILIKVLQLSAADNTLKPRYFFLSAEFGAGHLLYGGFGYDFAKKFSLWRSFQFIKSAGGLLGFSYISDDKIYAYEPSLFLTGELVNNKIKINSKANIDIDWRLKAGKMYLHSPEFDLNADVMVVSADFLLRFFRNFFIDISLPLISGNNEMEITPCIGTGAEYSIF